MQITSENFTIAKEGTIAIPGHCNVTLYLSNEAPVTLSGAHGVGNVQPSTASRVRFRNETGDPGSIHMKSPKEFGYSVSIGSLNRKEIVDDLPPPQPPVGMNFLQQLRRQFRQEMGVMREAFAETAMELGGGYEIDDDLLDEFEEEQAARQAKERKEKAAKEKADKDKAASNPQQNAHSATERPADGGRDRPPSDGAGGANPERSARSGTPNSENQT